MARCVALVAVGVLLLQARAPTPVKASFDLTWQTLTDVVRGDLGNERLIVVADSAGYRKARWFVRVPVGDPRASNWATCQGGGEPPVAPRSGVVDAVVRGDSVAATVSLTVEWSVVGPNDAQRAVTCPSYGEYENRVASEVRRKAEKAASRH